MIVAADHSNSSGESSGCYIDRWGVMMLFEPNELHVHKLVDLPSAGRSSLYVVRARSV